MARYAKANGVASRDIGDDIVITVQLDPELRWTVDVTGSPSGNQEQITAAYREMLEATTANVLDDVQGKPGPEFGTTQGYVFAHVTARHRFEIVQNPATSQDEQEGVVW